MALLVAPWSVFASQLSAQKNSEQDLYSNILNPGLINLTSNSYPVPARRMLHNDPDRGSWLLINNRFASHAIGH